MCDTVWKDPDGDRGALGVTSAADRTDWLAKVDFLLHSGRLRAPSPTFAALRRVAEAGGRWWALEHLAILTERPVIIRHDDDARPHCATGPAIEYPDGFAVYAWHGDRVPSRVVTHAEATTAHDLDAEPNPRVRLAMVECFGGWKRYLAACGAEAVQRDACGTLWRRSQAAGRDSWLLLEMESPTASSEGARKRSVLRVPPSVRTAREAVAWTFGIGVDRYTPLAEA